MGTEVVGLNFMKKQLIYLLLTVSFFCSCNSETIEYIDKTNTALPNGTNLLVEKTTTETTSRGIFTNHNYGTSYKFTYSFFIREGKINWDGGSGEPKNILFSKDSIYIRYIKDKRITTESIDSTDNTTHYDYHYELTEVYQKHIDKRYFFKLFGDEYWTDITSQQYDEVKKVGEEYVIPNDNELVLKK